VLSDPLPLCGVVDTLTGLTPRTLAPTTDTDAVSGPFRFIFLVLKYLVTRVLTVKQARRAVNPPLAGLVRL
jgi:hypothetical protein